MTDYRTRYCLSREEGHWYLWHCHRQTPDSVDFSAPRGFLKLTPTWQLLSWCVDAGLAPRQAAVVLLGGKAPRGLKVVATVAAGGLTR